MKIISMIKWLRTNRLSMNNSLSSCRRCFCGSESGPLRKVHLSRHKWPGGSVKEGASAVLPGSRNVTSGFIPKEFCVGVSDSPENFSLNLRFINLFDF